MGQKIAETLKLSHSLLFFQLLLTLTLHLGEAATAGDPKQLLCPLLHPFGPRTRHFSLLFRILNLTFGNSTAQPVQLHQQVFIDDQLPDLISIVMLIGSGGVDPILISVADGFN